MVAPPNLRTRHSEFAICSNPELSFLSPKPFATSLPERLELSSGCLQESPGNILTYSECAKNTDRHSITTNSMQSMTTHIEELRTAFNDLGESNFASAADLCRRVIESNPENAEAFHILGLVKLATEVLSEAKNLIEKAIELNPNEATYYNSLGAVCGQSGDRQAAKTCFKKAVELIPDYEQALNNLGALLLEDGDLPAAINIFTECINAKADNLHATTNRAIFSYHLMKQRLGDKFYPADFSPEQTEANTTSNKVYEPWVYSYIYIPYYKAVYAPVPKVACSSLKWVIYDLLKELVPELPDFRAEPDDELNFHLFMDRSLSMAQFPRHEANEILVAKSIFKFAFVRNPFHRVASAYLNKFVTERLNPDQWSHTWPVFNHFYGYYTDLKQDQISFRHFVDYLLVADDYEIDKHWAPMHQMVKVPEMDFIGRLETMEADFQTLRERLGLPPRELPHINRSPGPIIQASRGELANVGNHDLAKLPSLPNTIHLYDRDLEEKVLGRFKNDFEQLGYPEQLQT